MEVDLNNKNAPSWLLLNLTIFLVDFCIYLEIDISKPSESQHPKHSLRNNGFHAFFSPSTFYDSTFGHTVIKSAFNVLQTALRSSNKFI